MLPWMWSLVGCVAAAALLAMAGAAHSIRNAGADTNPMPLTRTSDAGVTTVASYRGLSYGPIADFEDVGTLLWDGPDGYPALELLGPDRFGFTNAAYDSEASMPLPGRVPPDPATALSVLFTSFTAGAETPADFANVAAFRSPSALRSSPRLDRKLGLGATTPVPEPSPAVLLLGGITALAWIRRRERLL